MATTKKDPVVVVLQMTGANDYLNTIIPYTNEHYYDARPKVGIPADQVLPIDDQIGFNPQHGADQEAMGRRQDGHHPRHRLRKFPALPLPLHGHLAHLRTRHRRHRGLGRPRDPRP